MMKIKLISAILGLWISCNLSAQQEPKIPFNGLLTDLSGKPIKRARVYVKSPKDYALTNKDGQFGLTNVYPQDTLKILIKKKQLYMVPVEGKKSMIIRLAEGKDIQSEEDQHLVDLGFGYISRREHTGVSNYISGDELRKSGARDVISALQGRVPGLNVVGVGGQGGANQSVSMRGTRSFTANQTPAFVIDGVVVPSFEGINLNDVDYVEIMKDATVYGSNGANGAIIVHLKTAR